MKLCVVTLCSRPNGLLGVARSLAGAVVPSGVSMSWLVAVDVRTLGSVAGGDAANDAFRWLRENAPHPWACDWLDVVAFDGWAHEPALRNAVLERVDPQAWIHFVDDDNLMHPDLVGAVAARDAIVDACVFDQVQNGALRLRAAPEHMHFGAVDTAQVVFRRSLVPPGLMFANRVNGCDGVFYDALFHSAPTRFQFINEPLTYYNAQVA